MRTFLALVLLNALAAGCLPSPSASDVNSGFTAGDCTSLKAQYDLQTGKLPGLVAAFDKEYAAYLAKQEPKKDETKPDETKPADGTTASTETPLGDEQLASAEPAFADEGLALLATALDAPTAPVLADATIKSAADCSKYPITGEPVYQACKELFAVQDAATAAAEAYNDPKRRDNCLEGAGAGVKAHLFAYCDAQCSFAAADCSACSFTFTNALGASENARMICASENSTREAISAYCGSSGCTVNKCETNLGSFYAGEKPDQVIAGTNEEEYSAELSSYLGAYGHVDVSAGVKFEVEGSVKATVGGKVSIVAANSGEAIRTKTDITQASTDVSCKVEISQMGSIEVDVKAGVAGSFKLFGNGAEADAGITTGGSASLSQVFTKTSPSFPGGGQSGRMLLSQCMSYVRQWIGNDLISHIRTREDWRVLKEVINTAVQQVGNDPLVTSATERGKKAAKRVYDANRTLAYYGACAADHNWVGIASKWLGRSDTGEKGCNDESATESGKYQEAFRDACYKELDRICVGS